MNDDFKWLGNEVECYHNILEGTKFKFYTSFTYNDQVYNVGDFGFCKWKSTEDRICRLMCLYESNSAFDKEKEKAIVKWYTRGKNLTHKQNPMRIKLDPNNEVIEDRRDYVANMFIPLRKITGKCFVILASKDDPSHYIKDKGLDRKLYYCCRFKIESDVIEPILSEDRSLDEELFNFTTKICSSPESVKEKQKRKLSSAVNVGVKGSPENNSEDFLDNSCSPKKYKSINVESKIVAAKRNLNSSFIDSQDESDVVNYSIVENAQEDPLKIKLCVSKRSKGSIPYVLLEKLSPIVLQEQLRKIEKIKKNPERRISFAATPKSSRRMSKDEEITPLRRSARATKRTSYAEPISPEKFLNARRGRTFSVDSCVDVTRKQEVQSSRPRRSTIMPKRYCEDYWDFSPIKSPVKTNSTPIKKIPEEEKYEYETPKKRKGTISKLASDSPKTPNSYKATPGRRAKLIREGIITPSVQRRLKPVEECSSPFMVARAQLHVSHIPTALPCRENEFENVYNFLVGKLKDGCGGCMYISGVPGTGKTATVTAVVNKLQEKMKTKSVPKFDFVSVNGMRLTEPRQTYVEIVKQLIGKTVLWEQAQSILDTKFSKSKKASVPVILLVDELDILCTKRQDVVYNLLDWPTKVNAQLIVVTIANTMDLPERLLMGRVTSRLGLTRLTFQPYTFKQLQEIVSKRLLGTESFNPDAVQLVARKVASVSGDARRALDICRKAAELAESDGSTQVSMEHVNDALNAMITQPKVQAIKYSSKLEQLILQSVVAEVERTGVEETTFNDVYTMLVSLCALDGIATVSRTVVLSAVRRLSACRLLLTEQKRCDVFQRIILNVSSDDVYYALRQN